MQNENELQRHLVNVNYTKDQKKLSGTCNKEIIKNLCENGENKSYVTYFDVYIGI